jgi:hypothetical protein
MCERCEDGVVDITWGLEGTPQVAPSELYGNVCMVVFLLFTAYACMLLVVCRRRPMACFVRRCVCCFFRIHEGT